MSTTKGPVMYVPGNKQGDVLSKLAIGSSRNRKDHNDKRKRTTTTTTTTTTLGPDHQHGNNTAGSRGEGGRGGGGDTVKPDDQDTDPDDHDHDTDHDEFSCQPASSQHQQFIQSNLEELKDKCDEFHACTVELYNKENFHAILAGEDLQLGNICGLMYANGGGEYSTLKGEDRCSKSERGAIRDEIGRDLEKELETPPEDSTKPTWKKLKTCVRRHKINTEGSIDTICRLKRNSTRLCDDSDVNAETEQFFNHELEHLHCSCAAINSQFGATNKGAASAKLPAGARYAVVGGVLGVILILVVVVICLCLRHRKLARRLSRHTMKFMPSPDGEDSTIYQEIDDCPNPPAKGASKVSLPTGYHFLGRAPSLPQRYVKPGGDRPRPKVSAQTNEYLEPLPDPPGASGAPGSSKSPPVVRDENDPTYQGGGGNDYDLARNIAKGSPPPIKPPAESDYFASIDLSQADKDGGYSTLAQRKSGRAAKPTAGLAATAPQPHTDSQTGNRDSSEKEPKYFVLETQEDAPASKKSCSSPDKIPGKGEIIEEESKYFVLETQDDPPASKKSCGSPDNMPGKGEIIEKEPTYFVLETQDEALASKESDPLAGLTVTQM